MKYIDFNDESIPLGKRKVAYVKWAISKGTDPIKAKKQANSKFGFTKKPGIVFIVDDWGRKSQRSYTGMQEAAEVYGYDLRKYEDCIFCNKEEFWDNDKNEYNMDKIKKMKDMYISKGYEFIEAQLVG